MFSHVLNFANTISASVPVSETHAYTSNPEHGMGIGLAVVGWIASIVIFLAYFPGTWRIIKTHQTFFLSKSMWILTMCALLSFVIYGGFLGAQAQLDQWGPGAIAAGFALVVFDGINFILCGIILGYKIHNQAKAKRLNTTEQKICEDYLKNHPEKQHHISFFKKHHEIKQTQTSKNEESLNKEENKDEK